MNILITGTSSGFDREMAIALAQSFNSSSKIVAESVVALLERPTVAGLSEL